MLLLTSAGKRLFGEALAAGTMEGFFKLIEQFRWRIRAQPRPCQAEAYQPCKCHFCIKSGACQFNFLRPPLLYYHCSMLLRCVDCTHPCLRSPGDECRAGPLSYSLRGHPSWRRWGCRTQDEPAYCGLATLSMTLNALQIGVRRGASSLCGSTSPGAHCVTVPAHGRQR